MVGNTSGAQKMAWSCDDPAGSAAKAEAPSPSQCRDQDRIGFRTRKRAVISGVIRIAAKAFPSKAWQFQFPGTIVGLR